jgi:uncharacterized SAM-binding protein YcdF (DUF218 family)
MAVEELATASRPRRWTKRRLVRVGLVFAVLAGAWVIAAWSLDVYGRGRNATCCYEAIIVLGAHVKYGGTATGSLRRRTEHAVELWRQGLAPKIVFTGASEGPRPSEASVAASIADRLGVPESAQVIEDRSTSTIENARNSKALIGPGRVLVVTDNYHVRRAELIFRKEFAAVDVVGVSNQGWPQMREAMREVLALAAYLVGGSGKTAADRADPIRG